MRVQLRGVSKGKSGETLPEVDVSYASGDAVLATAETEQRPTVLGLIASGRMVADSGSVTIDGSADGKALRRRVALVDAPPVCDPEPNVTVVGLTVEELMFAGRPSTIPAAKRWLAENGFAELARTPIGDLIPRDRIALLMQLTAMRPEVEGLVLVSPDRHRGEPAEWWDIARRFADDGYAVLVVAGAAAARVLGVAADGAEDVADAESAGEVDAAPVDEADVESVDEADAEAATAVPVDDDVDEETRFDSPTARSTTEGDGPEGLGTEGDGPEDGGSEGESPDDEADRETRFDSPAARSTTEGDGAEGLGTEGDGAEGRGAEKLGTEGDESPDDETDGDEEAAR